MAKKSALGKGLGALLSDAAEEAKQGGWPHRRYRKN